VLCGGRRDDLGPQFVEPTIIRMPAQTDLVKRETFAPILYLLEYETLDDALHIHNDVPQGLSSAIFTDSLRQAEQFLSARGSDCGIANVNIGTSGAEIGGAFGGEKETGGGRESGSDAWKAYMRRQTNTSAVEELPLAQGIHLAIEERQHEHPHPKTDIARRRTARFAAVPIGDCWRDHRRCRSGHGVCARRDRRRLRSRDRQLYLRHAAPMTLGSWADRRSIMAEQKIWVAESALTEEDVYWGAALAACEMIRAGIVGFADHYFWMDQVAQVVSESGMKALLAWCLFGLGADKEIGGGTLERTIAFAQRWHNTAAGRVRVTLGPHSPYMCSDDFLQRVVEAAHQHKLGIHLHVAESTEQVKNSLKAHGQTPVAHLAGAGVRRAARHRGALYRRQPA
jgi:hypothetical protein